MYETNILWENTFRCPEPDEECYTCPQCGARLEPHEDVYYSVQGVVGCGACLLTAEAEELLGPRFAA